MRIQKLGKFFKIKHGYAFKGEYFSDSGPYIVLTPGNFLEEGGFKFKSNEKYYIGDFPKSFILEKDDLIVAMTEQAEGLLGSSAIISKSNIFLHNQRLGLVTGLDEQKLDRKFLYYLLNTKPVRAQIRAVATGAKVRHTSPTSIYDVEFIYLPIETQRKIASILTAYDDLIENNTRRIKILEEMAQAIYREWFVNFRFPGHEQVKMVDSPLGRVPEGWGVVPLKAIVENRRDATSAGEHLSGREYVPIDCLSRKSLSLQESKPWKEAQSSLILFRKGDVLFGAMRSYFHKVTIAPFDGVTRTTCFVLQPRSPELSAYAIMTVFQEETVGYASAHARGATIPYAVWDGSLAEMKVLLPSKHVLEKFEETVGPMLKLIHGAFPKQRNLRQTRDLLLPKLISGEVDVSELEIEVKGAAE